MTEKFIALSDRAKNITGQRFNKLVAIGPIGMSKRGAICWRCQCDCGKTVTVPGTLLRNGNTKSCGCLNIEQLVKRSTTHGGYRGPLYNTWRSMLKRCTNPKHSDYMHYGGRGIRVCQEWQKGFGAFRDHVSALENYDVPSMSLDRINNNGNYEPGNVRWATEAMQKRNYRRNRMITFDGRTMCLADWSAELNMEERTIACRLNRGWPVESALFTPPRNRVRHPG